MADHDTLVESVPAMEHKHGSDMINDEEHGVSNESGLDDDSLDSQSEPEGPDVTISLTYRGKPYSRAFGHNATFEDLTWIIEQEMGIEQSHQKYLISGMKTMVHLTDDMAGRLLSDLAGRKIHLIGTETKKIQSFLSAEKVAVERQARRRAARRDPAARAARRRMTPREIEEVHYKFDVVRPLPNLPDPERSKQLLERLSQDPGIKAAMRKYKLKVGVLTEMEPLSNTQTTAEGTTRLLGLNRNQGDVIELRLWTDAYDGYRDYKTIRNTLCHELAHNRHGPHDRAFWDFCHQIEKDVHAASTGHTTGDAGYTPSREDDVDDHGGWTGGSYVLGSGTSNENTATLSRREILARAAELRRRRMDDDDPNGGNQGGNSS